ncbi:capsule assembly Wzi family protein [Flavobacterium taihuense]|uniref:Capsule assembly Wzi family protein n=1 Tax=Flavobacterium taihuense TaxID=2857508 RepID=A0ABS6XVT2_9FLAO|nr:capsule assembly Wzi family protein [Flavobacterium taihuense]MBW4360791.1 capsule assembly Wzi family protein [Flavobacterium taihuense]
MKVRFLLAITVLVGLSSKAQNIPIGSIDLIEQRGRNEQLLGNGNPQISYTLRPLALDLIDSTQTESNTINSEKVNIKALPITLTQQYNTFGPYGWNDGAMIPAKGYQTLLSAGFFAKYGILSVQLKPEYVFATNPDFEIFPLTESNGTRKVNVFYLNHTDLPAPFGNKSYSKLYWGQSNISVAINKFSIGLSTENMWWGPGTRNSLLMSNTAPGFLHFTFNTRQPIETFIGSFEGQIICGKLEGSGLSSPKSQFIINGIDYELPKSQDWRYINGLSINYHPKWVPGLFLGLNRTIQVYREEMGSSFSDYMPIFDPFQKKNLNSEDSKNRDQLASLFFRWVMKESKFEFYGESGWNDHSSTIWQLFDSPEHSRAYLFGFNKIFMLNKNKNKYLKVNFETTHLEQSADRIVRPAGAWYLHGTIQHGYTNQGEVIGAGIGPGSNLQTLDFSVWEKDKVWGIQVERYAHNMDFYYDAIPEYDRKWVDLAINTYAYKKYGNLGIQAKLNMAQMRNFQYQFEINKFNLQFQLSLQYQL